MSKKKSDADSFFSFREDKEPIETDDMDDFETDDSLENEDFHEDESFLEEETEESDELEEEEDSFSKDDPKGKRFEHWHSVAEKRKNELEAIKNQLEEFKAVAPIAEFLKANPQALDSIEQYAKQGASQKQEKPLEKPTRPSKPKDFSYLEAEENPDSNSAKYLQSLEQYQENLSEYYAQRDELRESKLEKVYGEMSQRATQQKLHQKYMEELQGAHGMSTEEATAFITEMDKPGSMTLDGLVDYWRFKRTSEESKDDSTNEKARRLREQARKKAQSKLPPKGAGAGSGKDDSDGFIKGLRHTGRNLFEITK